MLSFDIPHVRPQSMIVTDSHVVLYRCSEHLLPTRIGRNPTRGSMLGALRGANPYQVWTIDRSGSQKFQEARPGVARTSLFSVGGALSFVLDEDRLCLVQQPQPGERSWVGGVMFDGAKYYTVHVFREEPRHRSSRFMAFEPPNAVAQTTHIGLDHKGRMSSWSTAPNPYEWTLGEVTGFNSFVRFLCPRGPGESSFAVQPDGMITHFASGKFEDEYRVERHEDTGFMDFDLSLCGRFLAFACVDPAFHRSLYRFESWRHWATDYPGGRAVSIVDRETFKIIRVYDIPAVKVGFSPDGLTLACYTFAGGKAKRAGITLIDMEL